MGSNFLKITQHMASWIWTGTLISRALIQTSFCYDVIPLEGNKEFNSTQVDFLPSNLTAIMFSVTTRHKYCSDSSFSLLSFPCKLTHAITFQSTCWYSKMLWYKLECIFILTCFVEGSLHTYHSQIVSIFWDRLISSIQTSGPYVLYLFLTIVMTC